MLRKLIACGLFTIAALCAQQPSNADLTKLAGRVDKALGLRPGMIVADIGTGMALQNAMRIANEVAPEGRVTCVDVQQKWVDEIRKRIELIPNMTAVLGKDDDPLLAPGSFDAILVSNAYHEFTQPEAMLKHICDALKPDGTLVVVENYSITHKSESRATQVKRHDLEPEILERELTAAGFTVKERIDPVFVNSPERVRYLVRAGKTQ